MHLEQKHELESLVMSLSAHSIQGRRDHMEDSFDIAFQLKSSDHTNRSDWPYEYFYLGIFDGHGGYQASEFAKENLVKYITKHKSFWSDKDEDVMRAIREGFREAQEEMRKEMPNWTNQNSFLPSTAGTTASVLFIKNGKFYTGHVGDSRILILKENEETKMWLPDQITQDHKPELESELDRIQMAGGEVRDKLGVQRVVWKRPTYDRKKPGITSSMVEVADYLNSMPKEYPVCENEADQFQTVPFLAIARSLGDFWSLHPFTGQYVVSPEPDVYCRPVTNQDKAIVLASDGLWNVLGSRQTSRMIQELNILKSGQSDKHSDQYYSVDNYYDVAGPESRNYAKSLVYFAYQTWERRKLRSDNITVVVAMLNNILDKLTPRKSECNQQSRSEIDTTSSINEQTYKMNHNFATDISNDQYYVSDDRRECRIEQIGEAFDYFEDVRLGEYPQFHLPLRCLMPDDDMKKLENLLVLPPVIIKAELEHQYNKLVLPKNYQKLAKASYRRIKTGFFDVYIYIKNVSDDPNDESEKKQIRISEQGKEICDSSAQATQNLHDFGQAWNDMIGKNQDPSSEEDDDDHLERKKQKIRNLLDIISKGEGDVLSDSEREQFHKLGFTMDDFRSLERDVALAELEDYDDDDDDEDEHHNDDNDDDDEDDCNHPALFDGISYEDDEEELVLADEILDDSSSDDSETDEEFFGERSSTPDGSDKEMRDEMSTYDDDDEPQGLVEKPLTEMSEYHENKPQVLVEKSPSWLEKNVIRPPTIVGGGLDEIDGCLDNHENINMDGEDLIFGAPKIRRSLSESDGTIGSRLEAKRSGIIDRSKIVLNTNCQTNDDKDETLSTLSDNSNEISKISINNLNQQHQHHHHNHHHHNQNLHSSLHYEIRKSSEMSDQNQKLDDRPLKRGLKRAMPYDYVDTVDGLGDVSSNSGLNQQQHLIHLKGRERESLFTNVTNISTREQSLQCDLPLC